MNFINHHVTTEEEMSDFYCGCGGSSTGAKKAGLSVRVAANHWELALKTHNHNHPDVDHRLIDLLLASPAAFPYTAIAWFSPECTWHSLAMGQKRKATTQLDMFNQMNPDPAAERSRVTMWDVVRFSEYHRYQVVIVENVVEIKYWEPHNSWLKAMESLGYQHKVCYFNSRFFHGLNGQHGSAPQNRDRIYIAFWRKGNKAPNLDFRPLAYCPRCEHDVRAMQVFKRSVFPLGYYDTTGQRGQYYYSCPTCTVKVNGHISPLRVEPYYYAAYNIINWNIPAPKIGERNNPLKPNTLQRIQVGLEKFGRQPLMVELARSHARNNRTIPLDSPMPTQTTRQTLAFIMPFKGEAKYQPLRPSSEPSPTQTTSGSPALVTVPMLVEMYGGGDMRSITDPIPGVTAGGRNASCSLADPLPTIVISNRAALLSTSTPFVTSYYGGSDQIHGAHEPIFTITTKDRHSLILPEVDLEQCGFRMFEPDECKRGQGFDLDYLIYGSRKHQIKQIGNAVSTQPAEFMIAASSESMTSSPENISGVSDQRSF